jgi:hypothetical protein
VSAERFLIIKEKKLADYLAQILNSRARQAGIRLPGQFNLNGERRPSSRDAASILRLDSMIMWSVLLSIGGAALFLVVYNAFARHALQTG